MCGRYTLSKPEEIPARFETVNQMPLYDARYNVPPASSNPIVVRRSPNKVELARWGLIPFWARDPQQIKPQINARAEGITEKAFFREPIKKRRCLVPADGFYEWKTFTLEGKPEKFPWFIGLKNRKLFAFAGVYEVANLDGHETFTYSIVTTTPNKTMEEIHSRMPVILHQKDEDRWLASDTPLPDVLALLTPYSDAEMLSYPVSRAVNNPRNDDSSLINPATSDNRSSL
jgi:putative SOS response-associated peptidase YedK